MMLDKSVLGFEPHQNQPYDELLSAIEQEAKMTGRNLLGNNAFISRTICSLGRGLNDETQCAPVSLQIIGLVHLAMTKQMHLSDESILVFEKAVEIDPLRKYKERTGFVEPLRSQLCSAG